MASPESRSPVFQTPYRTLIADAPLVVLMVNAEGLFTLSEGRGLESAGLRPGEVVGRSAFESYGAIEIVEPSGTVITGREALDRVMIRGETVTGLTEVNGRRFDNTFIPIRRPDGTSDGMIGVSFDITDVDRSVLALHQSEEHVRAVLENISDVITVLSLDGTIHYESASITRVAGYGPDELVGRNAFEFIHPDDLPDVLLAFQGADGEIAARQFRFRHKDGGWLTLEGVGKAHVASDGTATAVVASRDVGERERALAERRKAESALAASQHLLHSVITSAPVILYSLDREGIFTLSEGRALEGLGLVSGQVVGQSALEMYSDLPELLLQIRRALAGEAFNSHADVRGRSYQTWFSPIHDEDGAVTGTVGVAIDVTEQRQLEEQLQQSQKLESIGRLAGGIAHDFNNMLTAIIGYSELVMDSLPAAAGVTEEMTEIRRAADRASLLTNQLLAFSRKQILRPKTLDVNEVVTDVSRMLQRLIGEDVAMVTQLGAQLGAVNADPGQLTQVLMNLAVNARDAMPDGGVLTLETANVELDQHYAAMHAGVVPGTYVMLAVSDTGSGMPPEVQSRIFEPFFTTKAVGKGTGMGLASVYGIVKQSGGHVWVYSEEGQGSTFKVYLPSVIATGGPLRDEPAPAALPRGTETVLLVEDEQMVRELVRRTLEGCGYTVIEAPDGPTALDVCGQSGKAIDLVITDVVMPKMNGRQLATELTAMRPGIRILFMSGYTDNAIVHHGVLDDATHFLQKPFAMRTLALKVREVLDR